LICHRDRSFGFLQIIGNFGELSKGGLELLDDFGSDNIGIGEIGAVFRIISRL
jgi:hypothetical protein